MVVGVQAISWCRTRFDGSSQVALFGALLAVLSWAYYEAQILLGGVRLAKTLTTLRGSTTRSRPKSSIRDIGRNTVIAHC